MRNSKSKEIVDAVLDELKGRSGLDSVLSEIEDDTEVWEELYESLIEAVETKLEGQA